MIDPGASADEQEAEAITPVSVAMTSLFDASSLPSQAETPGVEAIGKPPQGPGDPALLGNPAPESALLPAVGLQDAAAASWFVIAPAFQAAAEPYRLPYNSCASWAQVSPLVTASAHAVSAALSVPRRGIAGHLLPAIRADLGAHRALAKMPTSWNLGLLQHHQRLAAGMAGVLHRTRN